MLSGFCKTTLFIYLYGIDKITYCCAAQAANCKCTTTWLIVHVLCREFIFSACCPQWVVASRGPRHKVREASVLAVLYILVIEKRIRHSRFTLPVYTHLPSVSIVRHSEEVFKSQPISSVRI